MTRPRNEHPGWCQRDEEPANLLRHRSRQVRVGQRRPGRLNDRGQVTTSLTATGNGPPWVAVNAAHMVGVTVELSLDDAATLRDGLTELLRQAGWGTATQPPN